VGLATSDPSGAQEFYRRVFGWKSQRSASDEAEAYYVFTVADKAVAVVYSQTEMARAASVSPHWTSFVSVADADASAARASELGGTLPRDPFDVEGAGRIATVRDPVGAILTLWESRGSIGAELVNDVGAFCWNELATADPDRARSFYADLFGWEYRLSPSGYATILNAGARNGGIRGLGERERERGDTPNWTPYFTVENADSAARAAEDAGGTVVLAPRDFEHERIGVLADPQGAVFVIFEGETDP
jgi:predicted enzyme related to lactoylglutathione lyase